MQVTTAFAAALSAVGAAAITVAVLIRAPRLRDHLAFALLTLDLSLWSTSELLRNLVPDVPHSGAWQRVWMLSTAFMPVALLSAMGSFPRFGVRIRTRRKLTLAALTAPVAAVALTPYYRAPWVDTLLWLFCAAGLAEALRGPLLSGLSEPDPTLRSRTVLLTAGGGFVTGIALLCSLSPALHPLRNLLVVVYAYLLAEALTHRRFLDLTELLGRALVYSALALVLVSVYVAMTAWVGPRPSLLLLNTLVASFVILVLYDPLRRFVERSIRRALFGQQEDFIAALVSLRRRVATLLRPGEIVDAALEALAGDGPEVAVAFYIAAEDGRLALRADRGLREALPRELSAGAFPELLRAVTERRPPLVAASLREQLGPPPPREPLAEGLRRTLAELESLGVDTALPLGESDAPGALLLLRDDRRPEGYTAEEIAQLTATAAALSAALEAGRRAGALAEQDRLAALGRMSAALAHEVRNPLGAIKGSAQVLGRSDGLAQREQALVDIVAEESLRLERVVEQFLFFARPFPHEVEDAISVHALLERVARLQRAAGEAPEVEIAPLPEGLTLRGDPDALTQALMNLTRNAREASPKDAAVTLGAEAVPEDPARVRLWVRDRGPGIPEELREGLFEPFVTGRTRGSGLGLAICRRVAEAHEGRVWFEDAAGGGTRFVLELAAGAGELKV